MTQKEKSELIKHYKNLIFIYRKERNYVKADEMRHRLKELLK